jgi:hypothetical protein
LFCLCRVSLGASQRDRQACVFQIDWRNHTRCREVCRAVKICPRVVEVGHCLPKILVGHDCADTPKLIYARAGLVNGDARLNDRGLRLGIVQLNEQIAAFHALAFLDHNSDDSAGDLGRNLHARGYPNTAAGHEVLFDAFPNRDDRPDPGTARPCHPQRDTSDKYSHGNPHARVLEQSPQASSKGLLTLRRIGRPFDWSFRRARDR